MKYILSVLSMLLVFFSFLWSAYNANSFFDIDWDDIPYCADGDGCWLEEWIDAIKDIDAIETEQSFSAFIQNVVEFILWFLMLIAVLIIIYAWFNLMFWIWDEEKAKKTKQIIIYAIIWIVIIYLAWPLSDFIFNVLDSSTTNPTQ